MDLEYVITSHARWHMNQTLLNKICLTYVQAGTAYLRYFNEPSTVPEHAAELLWFNCKAKPRKINKIIIPLKLLTCCYGNFPELIKHMLYLT